MNGPGGFLGSDSGSVRALLLLLPSSPSLRPRNESPDEGLFIPILTIDLPGAGPLAVTVFPVRELTV